MSCTIICTLYKINMYVLVNVHYTLEAFTVCMRLYYHNIVMIVCTYVVKLCRIFLNQARVGRRQV